jgi:hypothetical protein
VLWLSLIVHLDLEGIIPLFVWMKPGGPRRFISFAKENYAK